MPLTNPEGENAEAEDYLENIIEIVNEYERLGLIEPN